MLVKVTTINAVFNFHDLIQASRVKLCFFACLEDYSVYVAVPHLYSGQRLSCEMVLTVCDTWPNVVQNCYY